MPNRKFANRLAGIVLTTLCSLSNAAGKPDDAFALEGVDWQLRQFRVGDLMRNADDGKGRSVFRFDNGRLSGSAGCNRLMGVYHTGGQKLSFEPHTAATMMACPTPMMEQERAVIDAIGQSSTYRIDGTSLRIADAGGETLLLLTKRASLPLTGTSWRLTWYNNGQQAIVSVLKDTVIMLQLRDDGQLAGKACNSYRGGFENEGDMLRVVGPIAATRMACPSPAGTSEQESAYFAALERVAVFRINGDEMTLIDADGSTLAKFKGESL
ncbi:MAG: META domain-containing protein [Thiohalocapsa sp.]